MKIREDFVTNSSSSSYITITIESKTGKSVDLHIEDEGWIWAEGYGLQDLVHFTDKGVFLEGRGLERRNISKIDELITFLEEDYYIEKDEEEMDEFIKSTNSLSDIKKITEEVDRYDSEDEDADDEGLVSHYENEIVFDPSDADYVGEEEYEDDLDLDLEDELILQGTQYEGRIDRIERVCPGDKVSLVRENDNPYDKNAIDVRNTEGSLGHLEAEVAEKVAPILDSGFYEYTATVRSVTPLSKRGKRCKTALISIHIEFWD